MLNYHTLTKKIDPQQFVDELIAAGLSVGMSFDGKRVTLSGLVWNSLDYERQQAQLALVAQVERVHVPARVTEVVLATPPHLAGLTRQLMAIDGVDSATVIPPESYPGTVTILHDVLSDEARDKLRRGVLFHVAADVPQLTVDPSSQVIAANDEATGTVTVSDSRGPDAAGKVVKIRIPPGGSGAIDADSVTLGPEGRGTITFQKTNVFTGDLRFEAYYESFEADPVGFSVRRGS